MAFFSNQGVPFAQAVGSVESTSRPLGPLTAYRDGSLGSDCPPCNCASGGGGGDRDGMQEEVDSRFAFDTPKAWHDGIFQAHEGVPGMLHAHSSGTVGAPSEALGLPLYLNGREVTMPLTIHHGTMGLGADTSAEDLTLDVSKAPGLADLKNLIRFWVASPLGKSVGLDASTIPADWVNTPWSITDGMLIQTILNRKAVPSPEQLKISSYDTLVAPKLTVGDQFYPLPQLIFYLATSLRGAAPAAWEGYAKSWISPFFKNLIPFWTEAFQQMSKMVSAGSTQDAQIMAAGLRVYPESLTITWPDGTVTRGSGVLKQGATTAKEAVIPPSVVPGTPEAKKAAEAAPTTNYILYGGLAALAVAGLYLTMKGPSRR